MNYDGIEIDMLALGDADSILVTRWTPGGRPIRVLIDGGNASSAAEILSFLLASQIGYIDHLVCTHLHDDHARGLVEVASQLWLGIGCAWCHHPHRYLDVTRVRSIMSAKASSAAATTIAKSMDTVNDLITVLTARGIPIHEPFTGQQVGPLVVLGPDQDYYLRLLGQFTSVETVAAFQERVRQEQVAQQLLRLIEPAGGSDTLLESPATSPENNSSVILGTMVHGDKYLFTADAGTEALLRAADAYDLANISWMQVPHHGSRRNITRGLISHFSPTYAFVSAAGNAKHPRRAVVNAFKAAGCHVFSTHYPEPLPLWHHGGHIPARSGYRPAYPLWNAPSNYSRSA